MMEQTTNGHAFNEAPASWNVRYHTPDGYDCQLTLRADTGIALLEKAEAALVWLRGHNYTPYANVPGPSRDNGAGYNGNGRGTAEPAATPPGTPDPSWCPVHGVTMKRHEKGSQVWYSHKGPDGEWCRGK